MNRYGQFTTVIVSRRPVLVNHCILIDAVLLAHYIAWRRPGNEASHWFLMHIILLVDHLGLHDYGISILIELGLLGYVHLVIGRLNPVLILKIGMCGNHCHACIRIID